MPFDPQTAKPLLSEETRQTSGFDPNTAKEVQLTQPVTQEPIKAQQDNTSSNPLGAVVGGLASSGADAVETGVGSLLWITDKLGITDKTTSESAKKLLSDDLNKWVRADEKSTTKDFFSKSYAENPAFGATSKAIGNVGMTIGAVPTMAGKGLLARTVAQTAVNVPLAAGMSDPENQNINATLAGVLTPAGNIAGQAIANLSRSTNLPNKIKSLVQDVNKNLMVNDKISPSEKVGESIANLANQVKTQEAQNYSKITSLEGTINSKPIYSALKPITQAPELKQFQGNQTAVLTNIQKRLKNLTTMEDALQLKQELGLQADKFTAKETNSGIASLYKTLKKTVDEQIMKKAAASGVEKDWIEANRYHHEIISPLNKSKAFNISKAYENREIDPKGWEKAIKGVIQSAKTDPNALKSYLKMTDINGERILSQGIMKDLLDDIATEAATLNPNALLRKVNKQINYLSNVEGISKDTLQSFKGLKQLLKDAGANATKSTVQGQLGPVRGLVADTKFIAGRVGDFLKPIVDNKFGMFLLKGVADKKPWATQIGRALKQGSSIGLINNLEESSGASFDSIPNPAS